MKKLGRRDLFKLAQVAGVGAAAGSLALLGEREDAAYTRSGQCRICTMHCGIVTTVRGDRLVRVEGDPASATKGFLCHHAYALPEIVHSPERIAQPLRRHGDGFEAISWENALAEIAERLETIKGRHGARAVAIQTGWPFVRSPLIPLLHRFCEAFGTPNLATVSSLCEASSRMGKTLTVGGKTTPDPARARTLVVWGANPTFSAPPFAHLVAQCAMGERNLIVIDPIRTELAQAATVHLQVRPGSDGALALGLMNVIVSAGLHDRAFLERRTVGFERLEPLLREYPPERVAQLTSVPVEQLRRAAHLFATQGPSSVWDGLGIEHHESGVQTVRAVAILGALCGFCDPLERPHRTRVPEPAPPAATDPPIGAGEHPLFVEHHRQAQANLFPRAILDCEPYPLRGLIWIGANPLVTSPASACWRRAVEKLELLVTLDPFLSASAERSHFVLPAATFLEAEGLVPLQPGGWYDANIVLELAHALGLQRYLPWRTLDEATAAHRAPPGAKEPPPKLQLYSAALARAGQPPLPEWTPPSAQPDVRFPLRLVSGPRTRPFINSQFRQIPAIRMKQPEPFVALHPATAKAQAIRDGQRVAVSSPHGRIELVARHDERVHSEVALLQGGWAQANANELTDDRARDPISGFPAFRSGICRVDPIG
jgi:anaerobic selenocysteine-containing dehydrogenase